MATNRKKQKKQYTPEELYNPQIDPSRDARLYARQSNKKQIVENVQSHLAQTVKQLEYTRDVLGYRDDGSTGKVVLLVENQVIAEDGTIEIKSASGTWSIDRRKCLSDICDDIQYGVEEEQEDGSVIIRSVGVVISDFVDRLFRDEDRIDSNRFIKICRENDCYVHITSKRMTYNFANPQHAELFRMEVLMAAAYIENHIRNTMLKRRSYAVEEGQWAGVGRIPMGLTVDKDPKSRYYKKFTPYEPHMEINRRRLFDRFIVLGFNLDLLCEEIIRDPVIYPPFEEGVFVGNRGARKLPDGSYMLSSATGIKGILTQTAFIGIFEREGKIRYDNHPCAMDKETFWLVYDHIKTTRPDGTPTGKTTHVSYMRKTDGDRRIPLLKKLIESNIKARAYHVPNGHTYIDSDQQQYYYQLATRGIKKKTFCCIDAEVLEQLVVDVLFQKIKGQQLVDIETARKERNLAKARRLDKIAGDIELIEEEINQSIENMGKLTIEAVIQRTEKHIARLVQRQENLQAEAAQLEKESQDEELGSLEEELQDLEELWDEKPVLLRKNLIELIISKIILDPVGSRFYRLQIVWKIKEWGISETYLDRGNGSKKWSTEEKEILRNLYPTDATKEDLLRALPARTWEGIEKRAIVMQVRRNSRSDDKIDQTLAYRDRLFLEEQGLSLTDFIPLFPGYKMTRWSSCRAPKHPRQAGLLPL